MSANNIPDGYLICNGSEVSKADFSDLYEFIGNTYGEPTSEDNFMLPNLIDKFLEGGTEIGEKEAGLPNITGTIYSENRTAYTNANGAFKLQGTNQHRAAYSGDANRYHDVSFDASRSNPIYGGSETVQPPALVMIPCININIYKN